MAIKDDRMLFELTVHKQSFIEVIANSFKLWRYSFKQIVPLSFVFNILLALPLFIFPPLNAHNLHEYAAFVRDHIGYYILFILIPFYMYAVLLHRMRNVVENEPISVKSDLIFGLKRFPLAVIAFFMSAVVIILGYILFIIPGVILSFSLAFFVPLVILDPAVTYRHLLKSLSTSWQLVSGNWWRTAITFVIPIIIFFGVGYVFDLISDLIWEALNNAGIQSRILFVHHIARIIFLTFFIPYLCSLFLVQIYNLKARMDVLIKNQRKAIPHEILTHPNP